jgi:hypothetical protein
MTLHNIGTAVEVRATESGSSDGLGYTGASCFSEPWAVPAKPSPKPLCEGHMTIDNATVVVSAPAASQPAPLTFDERWAAWEAKGAAHDRAVRRKMAIAAPILIVAAVVIYALLGR